MTRWQHFLAAFAPHSHYSRAKSEIVFVRADRIPDVRIDQILAGTAKEHELFRAFMQLLEDAEREAVDYVATNSWEPKASLTHAGGARYLRALREDILARRERKRTSNVQRPTPNAE